MSNQTNLLATWNHQSFLIEPTTEEWKALPRTLGTATKWAKGTLTITESENN